MPFLFPFSLATRWMGWTVSSFLTTQVQELMLIISNIRHRIITNETLFDCLDGVPIFLAMVTLNVFHPGRLIPDARAVERTTLA